MKRGLGRGLDSLFGEYSAEEPAEVKEKVVEKVEKVVVNEPKEIDIGLIDRNPDQPRKIFEETALQELADSIKNHGVIQPIIVKENEGRYVIIAGERRWRASRLAGIKTIPCVVKNYTEREISEIAIIENLQREDLNPIESAKAIRNLINQYDLTQDEVADKIGKSRPAVANTLRLLALPENIISLVENNKITAGHARALLAVDDSAKQKEIALSIIENDLTVRDVENLIKALNKPVVEKQVKVQSLELKDFSEQIKRVLSTKVEIKGDDNKGKIVINYYSKDDLNRIYDILNKR
ncbi:MAG: ParB/RepB/Spo0J family partition protein [Clostridiales bacterium]|nr:ParB/RepB/Spo0J family partition protein [Clostridiales bacterium]